MVDMMSIAEFAALCDVSRASIYKAGKHGRIRIFEGGKIDPNLRDSIAYRLDVSRQRHQARQDKASGFGIYARGGHKRSHRHNHAAVSRERPADPCHQIAEAWALG